VPLESVTLPSAIETSGTLVFLHGYGQKARHWSFLRDVLDLPWLEVVLLRGPIGLEDGNCWFRLATDLRRPVPETRSDILGSVEMVESSLERLGRPPERVVVGGFSQGGTVALELGLRSARPWNGVLCVSSFIPSEPEPGRIGPLARTRPILCTHGTEDDLVLPETADAGCRSLEWMGVPIRQELFKKAHGFDVFEERRRIRSWISERFDRGPDQART
jgi:predicted esterase